MKKILYLFLITILIFCSIGCQKINNREIVTVEKEVIVEKEKLVYILEKYGNSEYKWSITIDDPSILYTYTTEEKITPIISENQKEQIIETTPKSIDNRLYYIYNMESDGVNLNLAQLYMFNIDVHDIYILMRQDGTATICLGDNDIIDCTYDDKNFILYDGAIDYKMIDDNIYLRFDSEQIIFAPAEKIEEELKNLSSVIGSIFENNKEIKISTPEPTKEPIYDDTKYTFELIGLKEGSTIIHLNYTNQNQDYDLNTIYESYQVDVIDINNRLVIRVIPINN